MRRIEMVQDNRKKASLIMQQLQKQRLTRASLVVATAIITISCLSLQAGVECAGFWDRVGRAGSSLASSLGADVTLSAPRRISSRGGGDGGGDNDSQADNDDPSPGQLSVSASSASSDADNSTATAGSTGARCIMSRNPNFKQWPSVRFYTSRQESDINYSCSGGLNLDLTRGQAWLDENYDSYDAGSQQLKDELDLKGRLIDSRLYDGQKNTYVLVHGFLASWSSDPWMCRLKDLILNSSQANVFIVDWSGGSKPALPIDYSASVADVNPVAHLLAMLSQKLIDLTGQGDASRFHFIGHSLGSHISGLAGYALNGTVGRITAYDPAGLCFTNSLTPTLIGGAGRGDSTSSGLQDRFFASDDQSESSSTSQQRLELERARRTGQLRGGRLRLSQASARFVLALHSDIDLFGTQENVGHVDVFMNGGSMQPGCPANTLSGRLNSILALKLSDVFSVEISCSHSYSHDQWNHWSPLGGEQDGDHTHDATCYPMAYQCRSWAAFKAGECGMCSDWDPQCAYTGFSSHFQSVSLDPDAPDAGLDADSHSMVNFYDTDNVSANGTQDDDDDDDDYLSHELPTIPLAGDANSNATVADDGSANDDDLGGAIQDATSELSFGGQSRHFIKTSDKIPSCMYHYQILIGTRKALANSKFYVQIPLDRARKRFRQARVSHLVEQNTNSHESIAKGLRTLYDGDNNSNYGKKFEKLNYYSALITFASLQCSDDQDRTPFQEESTGHWQACEPLRFLNGTRLKAERAEELYKVELVAINYMSGLSLKSRRAFSHLLNADLSQGVRRKASTRMTKSASTSSPANLNRGARANQQDWTPDSSGSIRRPIGDFVAGFGSLSSRARSSISQGAQAILGTATFPVRCALGASCRPPLSSSSQDMQKIEPDYSVALRSVSLQ